MVDTPEKKVKDAKDDDVITALNPNLNEKKPSGYTNKPEVNLQEDQDNIFSQLDQFEQSPPAQTENLSSPIKESDESLFEEAPSPSSAQPSYYSQAPESGASFSTEQIEEITESIVDEKWEEFLTKIGDISLWKENVNNELIAIKQEILRTQDRFANLQRAILGKVDEYNQNIGNISTEMKALEKVFQKILQPLTSNIKELSRITKKLKKKS